MSNVISREEFDRELNIFGQLKYLDVTARWIGGLVVFTTASMLVLLINLTLNFADFSAGLANLEVKVSILQSDMMGVKADVANLKVGVAQLNADVTQLKTDVVQLKTDVSKLKSDMIEVKSHLQIE